MLQRPQRVGRDEAAIEQPVMVRTEHDDVCLRVRSAVLASHDVRDITRRLGPIADNAPVDQFLSDHRSKRISARVNATGWASTLQQLAVRDAVALGGTKLRGGSRARLVVERRTANGAVHGAKSPGRPGLSAELLTQGDLRAPRRAVAMSLQMARVLRATELVALRATTRLRVTVSLGVNHG